VQLTLAVHPRCGELAELLRKHGPDAVWIELAGRYVTIVPRGWTSLVPRQPPICVRKQPVHLAPAAAVQLAKWIAARCASPPGEKLDARIDSGDTAPEHGRRRRRSGRDGQPASVVEQAGASDRRRARGRARGRR
jgi:hypothetical protein